MEFLEKDWRNNDSTIQQRSVLVSRARISRGGHAVSLHPRRIMQASASLGGSAPYCRR